MSRYLEFNFHSDHCCTNSITYFTMIWKKDSGFQVFGNLWQEERRRRANAYKGYFYLEVDVKDRVAISC